MGIKQQALFFFVLLIISFALFLLDQKGVFYDLRGVVEKTVSPIQKEAKKTLYGKTSLELELEIQEKLANLKKLEKENEDLRLQFGIAKTASLKLILASVLSTGQFFIIDKGSDDGIKVDQTVVFKNILVGKIIKVSKNTSRVLLPSEKGSVIEAKDVDTLARGLLQGQEGEMIFREVILSEKLEEGDSLVTIGSVDENGLGIRPDLLIGKIEKVRKNDNQLFQEASIKPIIDYKTLANVFVIL